MNEKEGGRTEDNRKDCVAASGSHFAGRGISGGEGMTKRTVAILSAVIFALLLVCTVSIEATDGIHTAIRRIVSEEILVAASPSAPLSDGQIVKLINEPIPEG